MRKVAERTLELHSIFNSFLDAVSVASFTGATVDVFSFCKAFEDCLDKYAIKTSLSSNEVYENVISLKGGDANCLR